MSDELTWFERKFYWLESIAEDVTLSRLSFAIAFKLAWRYLNNETHDAWPKIDTLARELNAHPRNVRRALAKLVEAGKLAVVRGGGGPGDTNHYRMDNSFEGSVRATLAKKASRKGDTDVTLKEGARAPLNSKKGGSGVPKRGAPASKKGGLGSQPTPKSESRRETGSAASRRAPPLPRRPILASEATGRQTSGHGNPAERVVQFRDPTNRQPGNSTRQSGQTRGKAKTTGFPEGWVCGELELATAVLVCRWDLPTAEHHFRRFRLWHLQNARPRADWSAAWEKWCVDELEREANKQGRKPSTQMEDVWQTAREVAEEEEQKRRQPKH